ncbi:MAG: TetR/AcrR family transcriptional regulator [Spirochaetota bacterium]
MPPKTRFERSDIVEAAFVIARDEGLEAVKARRVADKLGSSVAPIYNNFETIDELVRAVVEHVLAISHSILAEQQGDSVFENIGRASLTFARMYPLLVRDLVLKPNPWIAANEQQDHTLIEMMAEEPALAGWSQAERRRLLLQMRAFQMGVMLMTANQQIPSWAAEIDLEQLLMQTSHSLVQARNNQTHRSEE